MKLRTKTGCLICRTVRKKCDEKRPWCSRCHKTGAECVWPSKDDLHDRRNERGPRPRREDHSRPRRFSGAASHPARTLGLRTRTSDMNFVTDISHEPSWLFGSVSLASDLELSCFNYFLEKLPKLLLSSAHPGFAATMATEIFQYAFLFDGLWNVAIACGAACLSISTRQPQTSDLGLAHYYRAVGQVSRALPSLERSSNEHYEAVQTAIMFLYLHGLLAMDTNEHVQGHVDGAIQLMNLQHAEPKSLEFARLFDFVMWESILYQVFRRAVRYPFIAGVQPDMAFVAKAHANLQVRVFPEASTTENTPIIGIPLELQKLIIEVAQFCRPDSSLPRDEIFELQLQMQNWETQILCCDDLGGGAIADYDGILMPSQQAQDFNQIATTLHILAASTLLDWAWHSRDLSSDCARVLSECGHYWQIRFALNLMKRTNASEAREGSYLGLWPALIVGYAIDTSDDVATVRESLQRAHQRLCGAEDAHYLHELESTWYIRGLSPSVPAWLNEIVLPRG